MKWMQLAGAFCLLLAGFSQSAWGQMGSTNQANGPSVFKPPIFQPPPASRGPQPQRPPQPQPQSETETEPIPPRERPPRVPRPRMVTTENGALAGGEIDVSGPSRGIELVQSVGKNRSIPFEVIRGSGASTGAVIPQSDWTAQKSLAEEALKKINAAQSVEELTPYLDHPLPAAQRQAVELLLDHGPQGRSALVTTAQSSKVRARVAALWGLGMNDPTNSEIELIVDAMRDRNEEVQRVAVQAAGRLGAKAATMTHSALMEALESDSAEVRTAASSAVAQLSPDVVPDLVRLLGARREVVRDVAGRTLVKIGEPAVAPLIEQLKDPRPTVRYWAVYSLGEIGAPAVEALPLLEAMAKSDPDGTVKYYAQTAVRRLTR